MATEPKAGFQHCFVNYTVLPAVSTQKMNWASVSHLTLRPPRTVFSPSIAYLPLAVLE